MKYTKILHLDYDLGEKVKFGENEGVVTSITIRSDGGTTYAVKFFDQQMEGDFAGIELEPVE